MDTIKSSAVEVMKSLISPDNKIINLKVRNKWLVATLSSGVYLWVLNE